MPGAIDPHELISRVGSLEKDVGHLRADFEGVKSDLRGVVTILSEIKLSITAARPAWYVIAPIALSFILIIAAGVAAFGSLKGDLAGLHAVKTARDGQLEAIDRRILGVEQRQWDELKADRDHLRARP